MQTKICTKCGEEKSLEDFHKDCNTKDGKRSDCKRCVSNRAKQYYENNQSTILKRAKLYRETNKEKISLSQQEYRKKNKDKLKSLSKKYYQDNRERLMEASKARYQSNREEILRKCKDYYQRNREKQLDYKKLYAQHSKDYRRAYMNEYIKSRRRSDPLFDLALRCRDRVSKALKGNGFSKKGSSKELLGCSYENLMDHLESQFTEAMSWENRSEWHIDHIVPLASAETEEELLALCHYTNLQPLWAKDNISKGAKLPEELENA